MTLLLTENVNTVKIKHSSIKIAKQIYPVDLSEKENCTWMILSTTNEIIKDNIALTIELFFKNKANKP